MIAQLFNLVVLSVLSVVMYVIYRAMLRMNNTIETQKTEFNVLRAEIQANKKILNTLYNNFLASGKDSSQKLA